LDRIFASWYLILGELHHRYGQEAVVVAPTQRAKYASGKGNASKDTVLLAVAARYPSVGVTDNNQADALVLAAMGARHLGHPVEESLPVVNLSAMDAVRWVA
jgi:Holliday junction resolvasome RuvABC endonuclease subunit